MARIALLEPYYAGSHAQWVRGLQRASEHTIEVFRLPGRFWKWRMHGAAVTLARAFLASGTSCDLILATDMLDLATFLSLVRRAHPETPAALYMHENQLTYPPRPGTRRNLHYGFTNYTSMLSADAVLFNSSFHRTVWFDELPRLLKHFPDYNELDTVSFLERRASVLPLGLNLARLDAVRPRQTPTGPLRILWNHRWEYDKQPGVFLEALYALQSAGSAFEVIILGESFRRRPEEFLAAQRRLARRMVQFGYAETPGEYARWLWHADVQVSTAIQDFFGGSTCEAIYCNCLPILPNRLNYPAFIPSEHRSLCLYDSDSELVEKLRWACEHTEQARGLTLRESAARFDWRSLIEQYDAALQAVIDAGPQPLLPAYDAGSSSPAGL